MRLIKARLPIKPIAVPGRKTEYMLAKTIRYY
jgi:hypothetical protein